MDTTLPPEYSRPVMPTTVTEPEVGFPVGEVQPIESPGRRVIIYSASIKANSLVAKSVSLVL
jgi:hypothetical protein